MLSVIYAECHYAECHLCLVSFMLSVIYAECHYAECHLCSVSFMLSVIYADCHLCLVSFMLSLIMLNVVAPFLIPLLSPGWYQTLVQRIMYLEFNHCVTRAQRCLPSK